MLLAGASLAGAAQPHLEIDQLCQRLRQSASFPDSFAGTEVVTVNHIGYPAPDLSNHVVASISPEGTYRWFIAGSDWWMVKEIPSVSPAFGPMMDVNIIRNYEDQVLSYTFFRRQDGKLFFAVAHLDQTQYQSVVGPAAGRRWNMGSIADLVENLTEVKQAKSASGIEIDGLYKGAPVHLTVAPQFGYLTTSLEFRRKTTRSGFSVTKVRKVGRSWMPEDMDLFSGPSRNGAVLRGSTGHVHFADFVTHPSPSKGEVPPIPAGSMMGSDGNRLYRVAQNGALVDFGRMGFKPGTPLAWGDLFVFSGAGLLIGSVSWTVFRKRKLVFLP